MSVGIEQLSRRPKIAKELKINLLTGMLLTRATDNALKYLFLSGIIKFEGRAFQGKGFRSLGQEAIFAATSMLKVGKNFKGNSYSGDVVGPLIRDLGVYLAMTDGDVESALNAQAAKSGAPSDGRDLHYGDFENGVLMPAAPLAIASCSLIGVALAFKRKKQKRIAISFVGEGASSLGEWHEAINFAAVNRLPMLFCIQNNQTALSTPRAEQCVARNFAAKALGYGIESLSIDGNDVEKIASGFKLAADYARTGKGPVLIEIETMRMCGHAHHDDMLYLGKDPKLGFEIPILGSGGYVDKKNYEKFRAKDPIENYQRQLLREKIVSVAQLDILKSKVLDRVQRAVDAVKKRPWPKLHSNDQKLIFKKPIILNKKTHSLSKDYYFSANGSTYLQAIAEGVRLGFDKHKNSLMIGEDVALPYGNAFMMFKNFGASYKNRFLNTPISENAIVGACVGLAMEGFRPVGEIQFNDFVACAMNQVANNVAKFFFRTGCNLPMVLRMPYGGLRRAGPFHSQDTSPWFYRCHGLKIMAPSSPIDAKIMYLQALNDPDPVLFYEHINLYRDPSIKQILSDHNDAESSWRAKLVNEGSDLTIISYGAYVHIAHKAAKKLESDHGRSADVIDLRYLSPIDLSTCYESIKKCSRVLLLGEDSRTGSILESIASRIGQELFNYLDAPVSVLGSRDIPVPYSPPLEDSFLLSEEEIIKKSLDLIQY